MGVEIERKFLLASDAWRAQARDRTRMEQGYLGGERCPVRVRIEGDAAFLNIKSRELGARRLEFEQPLPLADAQAMLAAFCPQRVQKWRHRVDSAPHVWEIDEFHGDNAGLVVAEIELGSVDEDFAKPDWVGAEATHAQRYYNLALASRPYSQWREDERLALDLTEGH